MGNIQTYKNEDNFPVPDTWISNSRTSHHRKRDRRATNIDCSTKITAFLANMSVPTADSLSFLEYLNVAHDLSQIKKDEDTEMDEYVNLSDFIPEPRSLI